ncbi:hypothetical protein V8F33_014207 [Rhypophila sp. PSN 637]
MRPFVYLPKYPFVICHTCRYTCVANEVNTHLRKQHTEIKPTGLCGFLYPPATTEPISFIAAPEVDGIRCDKYGFTTRTIRGIQGHYQEEHRWENDWKKGGNVAKRARQDRRITQIHKAQANKFEEKKQQIIQAGDEKAEPNPWLRRVGWAEHLKGLDKERLRESMGPIGEDEATLQRMWDSLGRVMDQARAAAVLIRVGHTVLFEVNRKEAHIKARKPFDSRIEDNTWVRYREEDEARPPLYDAFKDATERSSRQGSEDTGNPSAPENLQAVDRLCLDTIVSYYKSAIVSGTTISKEEAEETVTGLFTIVRKKVQRFLIVVSDKIEPRPIDWIFDARTYRMRIRYTMTAVLTIDWRIRFNMYELSDMLHGLVQEVRVVMGRLLMVEKDDFRLIPRIEWTKIEDDYSEDGIGYSFLQDDRNPWMFQSEERQVKWVLDYYKAYGKVVETFREGILTIIYILGGMPARS